jgi:hypothetical protein
MAQIGDCKTHLTLLCECIIKDVMRRQGPVVKRGSDFGGFTLKDDDEGSRTDFSTNS